jgi:hypothetical protein
MQLLSREKPEDMAKALNLKATKLYLLAKQSGMKIINSTSPRHVKAGWLYYNLQVLT